MDQISQGLWVGPKGPNDAAFRTREKVHKAGYILLVSNSFVDKLLNIRFFLDNFAHFCKIGKFWKPAGSPESAWKKSS